jgi:hypothetical protein
MRVQMPEHLREPWNPVIVWHWQVYLAACAAHIRSLAVSFAENPDRPGEFSCELRGKHADGTDLRIRSCHGDGEVAIAHGFARARREIGRRRRLFGAPG